MSGRGIWRCLECDVVAAPDSRAPNADDVECPVCGGTSWGRLGRVR